MTGLHDTLKAYVDNGSVPGAVGLVALGDRVEVAAVGSMAVGGAAMARDSIFRFASVTKLITAAGVMMLVEDGRIALDDPGARQRRHGEFGARRPGGGPQVVDSVIVQAAQSAS